MDAINLADTYKQGQEYVTRAAESVRDLYLRAEDQLPEGSMKYVGLALAGLAISVVSYRLGKSRIQRLPVRKSAQRVSNAVENTRHSVEERMSAAKEATQNASQRMEQIDFTPLYKLARLWLVYKISL